MTSAVVTYIYPQILEFLPNFLKSLENQTTHDFCVYIFNDHADLAGYNLKDYSFSIQEIEVKSETPVDIRYESILYLKNIDAENIIFFDADDLPSSNRVEVLSEKLKQYPMVCNDITLFDSKGVIKENIWSDRVGNNFVFDADFITKWNICGLGNTAIKKNLLNVDYKHNETIKVYDWYMFYQIIKKNNIKVLFTDECLTFYRQHEANIAGIAQHITQERMDYVKKIKLDIYDALLKIGFQEFTTEKNTLENKNLNIAKNHHEENMFWWEETEIN